jgi:ABC-type branched-subunit amino acid transport system ATPase component
VLQIDSVTSGYGRAKVLHRVSLDIRPGQTTCLLGPNGAGKTTLTRMIGGLQRCWSGRVLLNGEDVTNLDARSMVRRGVAQVLEGRHLFPRLPVLDNLLLGAYPGYRKLGPKGRTARLETVYDIFPLLSNRRRQLAGTLSGGEQQMAAIGRALMAGPKVLILDEPVFGLAPVVADTIYRALSQLNAEGLTIILAEEEPARALALGDVFAYVLVAGEIVIAEPGSALAADDIAAAYLGTRLSSSGE